MSSPPYFTPRSEARPLFWLEPSIVGRVVVADAGKEKEGKERKGREDPAAHHRTARTPHMGMH